MELLQKHFDTALESPDGIKKLRELILTLAMQGKLVKQDPKDQPASELLKEIQAEKEKIASREGAKARGKKLRDFTQRHEVAKEEKPYELPESWVWVRFGEIAQHNSGKTLDSGRNRGVPRDYITTSNLYWGRFVLDNVRQMLIQDEELEKCTAKYGDLLICEGGEAGRAAVWMLDYDVCFQNHVHRARFFKDVEPFFAYRFFEKLNATGEINQHRKGVGISNMSSKALSTIFFPLPPLAEQKRIVAKIDELMKLCDKLEKQRNARKEKILAVHRAAIRQVLEPSTLRDIAASRANSSFSSFESETVSQAHSQSSPRRDIASSRANSLSSSPASRANSSFSSFESETVSQAHSQSSPRRDIASSRATSSFDFLFTNFDPLYSVKENVAELKKAILTLAMQGKLVSQNPNDQPASELLKEIQAEKEKIASREGAKARGKGKELPPIKPEEIPYQVPESWEWCRLGEISSVQTGKKDVNEGHENGHYPFFSCAQIPLKSNEYSYDTEALLLPGNGANVGQVTYFNGKFEAYQRTYILSDFFPNTIVFVQKTLEARFLKSLEGKQYGSAINYIKLGSLTDFLVPLPPLAEQKRIVAKIDELMALCDKLEKQIDQATTKQTALFDAVLAKV